jgi:hypothetical protein
LLRHGRSLHHHRRRLDRDDLAVMRTWREERERCLETFYVAGGYI